VHQRADFHAPVLGVGPARRDLLGAFRGGDVDDTVAGERLLGLEKGPVGNHDDAVAHARRPCLRGVGQALAADPLAVADRFSTMSPATCMQTSLSSWESSFQASVFW
jgi:hypothetical protein